MERSIPIRAQGEHWTEWSIQFGAFRVQTLVLNWTFPSLLWWVVFFLMYLKVGKNSRCTYVGPIIGLCIWHPVPLCIWSPIGLCIGRQCICGPIMLCIHKSIGLCMGRQQGLILCIWILVFVDFLSLSYIFMLQNLFYILSHCFCCYSYSLFQSTILNYHV